MDYDLLIVGAGSAGMPCAIRAAQAGKRVCVIEKDVEVGGTLHLTAGHLSAGGTKRQVSKGFADNAANHYADIVRISRNTMDAIVAEKATALAPSTLDWLDELGYPFHEKTPLIIYGHEPYSVPRTYFGANDVSAKINQPGKTVFNLLLPLWQQLVAEKKISILLEHKMTALQKEGNEIVGVEVEHKQMRKILQAKNYVLTTGGYASNPAFFASVTKDASRLVSTAKTTSTGDGIIAAMNVSGAFVGGEKHSSTLGGMELEPNSGRANFWQAWARVSNGMDRKQREIYVNEQGARFMNEYDLQVDDRERIVLQQPNKRFWLIFDKHALHDGDPLVPQWTHEQLIAESRNEKAVWQADTIEALANKIGLPANALSATVSQYNHFVQQQKDEQFGRSYLQHAVSKAPFYAVLVYAYSLISFGGLRVNENLQVICTDGTHFSNLYAAGEILGAAATSGHAFCGGMLLTPAIAFGKWLGETL
jgi:succinate dehydrogenase/fumarate reductase flavoprotein subunit